jgi:transcriptional regulator with XRE-family HTH domain
VFASDVNLIDAHSINDDSATLSPDSINKLVGGRLHIRRTSQGISGQALSKFLRIDRSELEAYETGAKHISASVLLRIAKILDVRPDYFFQGADAKPVQVDSEHRKVDAA